MLATAQTASSSKAETIPPSKIMLWSGRGISGLIVAFLMFDALIKVLKLAPAVEGTIRLGYPVHVIVPIGLALLVSTVLYAIPRTAILGAILLTGYLGGATATQVRVEDPWLVLPVVLGVLLWAGLCLRDPRLRALIPVRK
jgi:hypothetical protein